jgi:hypothetical protein
VDDLSDWLDLSVDEAQELLDMAQAITEARRAHAREQSAGVVEAAEEVEAAGEVGEGAMVEQGAEEAEEEKWQSPEAGAGEAEAGEAEAGEAEAGEAEVGEEENEASAAER